MESELARVVDVLPGLVWTALPNGYIDFLNRRWCEYTGLGFAEVCGEGWQAAIHPEDLTEFLKAWRSILASGEPREMEVRLRRFDGQYRWFVFRVRPLTDASGQIVKWCGISTDVEERKHAADAIREIEARKAAIMDSALDCIVTIDHEGHITEFNRAAERTFGYCRDEIIGKQLADTIIPPLFREAHRRGFAHYVATGDARVIGKRVEMTAMRADGSEFPVELAITRIPLDGPPSFTGYLRDLSERKKSEEEIRRSEAFLTEAQHLSAIASFSWKLATDEIKWSEHVYRIFEFDPTLPVTLELIAARVHPEDLPMLFDMIDRARSGGNGFEYEHRLLMPDNSVKYVHLVAH